MSRKFERDVKRLARRYGFRYSIRRNSHGRLDRDGFPTVYCSTSPTNREHALLNIERDILRALRSGD